MRQRWHAAPLAYAVRRATPIVVFCLNVWKYAHCDDERLCFYLRAVSAEWKLGTRVRLKGLQVERTCQCVFREDQSDTALMCGPDVIRELIGSRLGAYVCLRAAGGSSWGAALPMSLDPPAAPRTTYDGVNSGTGVSHVMATPT